MNILITGSSGFIGQNIIKLFDAESKHNIYLFDIQNSPMEDIRKLSDVRHAVSSELDCIIHLAAEPGINKSLMFPMDSWVTNVNGTLYVLEMAREFQIEKIFVASSAAADFTQTPYGASKSACESLCAAYYHSFNVPVVTLRFSNVYGPESKFKSSVVAKWCKSILDGNGIYINGDGTNRRDFLFVEDLAKWFLEAVEMPTDKFKGQIIEIGSGDLHSITDLATMFYNIIKTKVDIKFDNALSGDRDISRPADLKITRSFAPNYSPTPLNIGLYTTFKYFNLI